MSLFEEIVKIAMAFCIFACAAFTFCVLLAIGYLVVSSVVWLFCLIFKLMFSWQLSFVIFLLVLVTVIALDKK